MEICLTRNKSVNCINRCDFQTNYHASLTSQSNLNDGILENHISISKEDVYIRSSKEINDISNREKNQLHCKERNSHIQTFMEESVHENGRFIHTAKPLSDNDHKVSKNDVIDSSSIDFTFVERISNYRKKMCIILDQIAAEMHNIPEPDDARDMARRKQRVLEFSSRFSRNYLYQLKRQVYDLEKEWRNISVVPMDNRSEYICHKITTAHQVALNALQAYYRHMPSSIGIAIPVKLKELLFLICTLIDCCKNFDIYDSSEDNGRFQSLQKKCNFVSELTNSGNFNYMKTVNKVTQKKKDLIPARLSMYRGKHFVTKKSRTISMNIKHKITCSKEKQTSRQSLLCNLKIDRNKISQSYQKQTNSKKLTRSDIPIREEAKSLKKGNQQYCKSNDTKADNISTVMQSVSSDELPVEEKPKFGNVLKMPDVVTECVNCLYSQSSNTSLLPFGEDINILHKQSNEVIQVPRKYYASSQHARNTKQCTVVEPRRNIRLELCQYLDTRKNSLNKEIFNEVQGQNIYGNKSTNSHFTALQKDQPFSDDTEREQINGDKPSTKESQEPITPNEQKTLALEFKDDDLYPELTTEVCNNFLERSDMIERVADQFGTITLEKVIQEVENSGLLLSVLQNELK